MSDFRFQLDGVTLTQSDEKIIDYIYQHISTIPYLTIDQLAKELEVSIATLSRFVRHVGYPNFKELKNAIIAHESILTPAQKFQDALSLSGTISAKSLLHQQQEYIDKTIENLSEHDINKAVKMIRDTQVIHIFGKGASAGPAELLSFRIKCFQKHTIRLHSSGSELFEDLAGIRPGELIVIFAFYKISVEAKVVLDHARKMKIPTILVTDRLYTEHETRGDVNLYVYRGGNSEHHSMTALVALIDALVVLVANSSKEVPENTTADRNELRERYSKQIPL